MVDNLLLTLFILFGMLFPPLLILSVYWLYIAIVVICGLMTEWNEEWYFRLVRRFKK